MINLQNVLELLKKNHQIGIDVENRFYVLVEANHQETLQLYSEFRNDFELLIEATHRLESYVKEINPLAYDIIEFSEKPITLVIPDAKNIAKEAMKNDGSISIRVVRDGSLQQVLRKFRMPLVLLQQNDTTRNRFNESEIITLTMEDAFMEAGIIKLEANGKVEVIKK